MWESIKSFWGDVVTGYQYGDEAPFSDFGPGVNSYAFKIGDYAEDVVGFISRGVTNVAKDFGKEYAASKLGGDGPTSRMPTRTRGSVTSSAGSGYQTTGKYRASQVNYNEIGYADPRVQQAARQLTTTNNPTFQAAFNPIPMNLRQGTPTMRIDMNPSVNVRTQTEPVEIA